MSGPQSTCRRDRLLMVVGFDSIFLFQKMGPDNPWGRGPRR